jgi:transposase
MPLSEEISSLQTLVNSLLLRVSQLENEISNLSQENILLRQENHELKSKLEKNSSNSHKPPSSDGYAKRPALPKTTNKAVGGQKGNAGKTLQMVNEPDLVVKHHLEKCPNCQGNLSESDVIKVGSRHQSFDLPVQKLLITEHQLLVSQCSCGCQNKATLPDYLSNSPVQYGPNIKALAVYLNTDFKIPFHKISTLFSDLYGYEFNESTAFNANQQAYQHLEPVESHIKEQLMASKVLHADETGLRCAGSLQWLHVASNEFYTYLFIPNEVK